MILYTRMNSFVEGSTHRIFSCCSSERIIHVRAEWPNLRGPRSTSIVASVTPTAVKYVVSRDSDRR